MRIVSFQKMENRANWVVTLFLSFLLLTLVAPSSGLCDSSRNFKIRAGFSYRFILFTEWPEVQGNPQSSEIVIGIVGDNPQNQFLAKLESQPVGEKKIVVRYLPANPDKAQLLGCQVVIINKGRDINISRILQDIDSNPILTISHRADFVEQGGMIGFFYRRNRIQFVVNRGVADIAGLRFRAQMLRMANQVIEGDEK